MNIKIYFLLGAILPTFSCQSSDSLKKLYMGSFLKNHITVRNFLKKAGFEEITFKTSDKLTLSGLFLSRTDATCNVIICAGWLPGRKEGMATFYDLLPKNCNILLFDARGHGESEGPLFWNLWRYGVAEYKDIVGAITYINRQNTLPIIIGGICSGAFNAAHAIIHLEKKNLITHFRIKGLIFDSGWGSILKIVTTAPIAGVKKRIASLLGFLYGTKKRNIVDSKIYQLSSRIADHICALSAYLSARLLAAQYDHITNLSDKVHQLTSPVLFIHSHDDTYADFDDALQLADLTPNKQCWWLEQSYHAKHHILYKNLYKEKLAAFISTAVATNN